MKTTLLLGFLLFLTACSDSSSDNQRSEAASSSKEGASTPKEAAQASAESTATAAQPIEAKTAENEAAPLSGHALFAQKCASCHGQNGEKAALNKSQIIAGWDEEKSMQALQGYQAGTYGGSLKGIMKGQASSLTAQQIEALSHYISTL